MKVGDLVKIEGGTLRPPWYGESGIIISFDVPSDYKTTAHFTWYVVSLASGSKIIRSDMIKVLSDAGR